MPKTLLLVRHGQTQWNLEARIQGRCDSPLTELGRQQAKANAEVLIKEEARSIVASPAGRVKETLACMADTLDVPVRFDERLLERDMGLWEQMEWNEVKQKWKQDYFRCRNNPRVERPPHGESLQDVENRLAGVLEEIQALESSDDFPIAIVSHGGTTRSILGYFGLMDRPENLNARFHNDVVYGLSFKNSAIKVKHYDSGQGPFNGVCTRRA